MIKVEPEVYLIASPKLNYTEIALYLQNVHGEKWLERFDQGSNYAQYSYAQDEIEFAGRLCYRSWDPVLIQTLKRFVQTKMST